MLDWNRGLGTCQHCGEIMQLHTYVNSKSLSQSFEVPVEKLNPIEEKIYNYFDKRGISRPTLNEL